MRKLRVMRIGRARLRRTFGVASTAVLGMAIAISGLILGLASGPATGDAHWPWGLDVVRRHPWPSVAVCAVAGFAVLPLLAWLVGRRAGVVPAITSTTARAQPDWVVMRAQVRVVAGAVRSRRARRTVAITTAIHGAGGFGKTKIAEAVCADPGVRRHFGDRVHMLTLGRDARSPSAIAARVGEATRLLTDDQTTSFESPRAAGEHLAKLLKGGAPTLLVLDDVWYAEQVAPFAQATGSLVLLLTTRRPAVLPAKSKLIEVDEMRSGEARAVLTYELDGVSPAVADQLADACGNWPLLLRLANRTAVALASTGLAVDAAAAAVLEQLRAHGPTALDSAEILDLADPDGRERAVSSNVELALELLPPGGRERYTELGVFAEDEDVPVNLVIRLWEATSGLDETGARLLCRTLANLSLIGLRSEGGGTLRLHDVYRDLLRAQLGARLPGLNAQLVSAAAQGLPSADPFTGSGFTGPAWWQSPDGYVSDVLVEHLIDAGRADAAEALCGDLRWISARLRRRGANAPLRDLARVGTAAARERAEEISKIAHLLRPVEPDRALPAILASRLAHLPGWSEQAEALIEQPELRPLLVNSWPPADRPHPALMRIFPAAHGTVRAVAFSADGASLAYVGDAVVEIADLREGTTRTVPASPFRIRRRRLPDDDTVPASFRGKTFPPDNRFAIAPDGTWKATLTRVRRRTQVRDLRTRKLLAGLDGHSGPVNALAVSPDGKTLASAGQDAAVRLWETGTWTKRAELTGHEGSITALAYARDGQWLASAGADGRIRLWDPDGSDAELAAYDGHSGSVTALAVDTEGSRLASGGEDETVRLWRVPGTAAQAARPAGRAGASFTVPTHTFSDRRIPRSLARGGEIPEVWRPSPGKPGPDAIGFAGWAPQLAVSPDGSWVASGSMDRVVRIWDPASGTIVRTLTDHETLAFSVAAGPGGRYLVSGDLRGTIRFYDPRSGETIKTLGKAKGAPPSVASLAVAPDGSWLAAPTWTGWLHVWHAAGDAWTAPQRWAGGIVAVAVSADGSACAIRDKGRVLIETKPGHGKLFATDSPSGFAVVHALALSPDASRIAAVESSGRLVMWDTGIGPSRTASTERPKALPGDSRPYALSFSPNGCWLASTHDDETLRIWNVQTHQLAAAMRAAHWYGSCVWAPDGSGIYVLGPNTLYRYDWRE